MPKNMFNGPAPFVEIGSNHSFGRLDQHRWNSHLQDELDKEIAERKKQEHELKVARFKHLHPDIREAVLSQIKQKEVAKAMQSIAHVNVQPSQKEQELAEHYKQCNGYYPDDRYPDDDGLPSYAELIKEHSDRTAEQVLLGDQ
jgi:hypothetical protein